MERLAGQMKQCAEDMRTIAATIKLDAQVRAYDLLDALLAAESDRTIPVSAEFAGSAASFLSEYESCRSSLAQKYDEVSIRAELSEELSPLRKSLEEARFEAAAAASLHEFAKEVFQTWQTSGIFARRRALRELRERAGFRLESHRIGNYVAKTFDLMNEAHARFAKAQQNLFAADVSYKIRPGLYDSIAGLLISPTIAGSLPHANG